MKEQRPDIRSLTGEELREFMISLGEPAYRASQIYSWLHARGASDYEEMTDLPASLRKRLTQEAPIPAIRVVRMQTSALDGTKKALFAMDDESLVESVLMRYRFGNSICVSSQVGCRMGCAFCASTLGGLSRNLSAGEMLSQVYEMERCLTAEDDGGSPAGKTGPASRGARISHVVVMGSGEPMENLDAVIRFFRQLADEKGRHLSFRNMTVSTCGIVPGIRRLTAEGIPVNLALSLHAPNDDIRRQIMPVAREYALAEVLDACRAYFETTGRRLTWEYALIRGLNDKKEHARELAALLRGQHGVVNLIPVNPVTERGLKEPDRREVIAFQKELERCGQEATIRRTLGRDIDGACGQLRRRVQEGTT